MSEKVLVIAAHPDDEVLGCGGTIAKHANNGDEVRVLILAEGITSRSQHRVAEEDKAELAELSKVAEKANKLLGVSKLYLESLPDNRMDSIDLLDIVKLVEKVINEYQPGIVYTHHVGDVNIDHRITHEAVITACRPLPSAVVKTILFFEVASSTEWQTTGSAPAFNPNWFADISDTLSAKTSALEVYASEMRPWPHARSLEAVEHLAKWRGATVGKNAAEAFMLGRNIQE